MILSLSLQNFGLFKNANVDFDETLNIITGESGTGKSMFIKALNCFLTGQIPQEIRNGTGSISACFYVEPNLKSIIDKFIDIGKSQEIIISSTYTEKRAFFRVNNIIVPKEVIQNIGGYLIELHSQDSNVMLRDEKYQNMMIHNIIREDNKDLFKKYDELFVEYKKLREKRNKIPSNISELYRKIDLIEYQTKEITEIEPELGEDEELSEKFKALNNMETIRNSIFESLNIMKENEFNLDEMIGNIAHNISKLNDYGFKNEYDTIISIQDQISDLYETLESKLEELDVDPDELERVTERLNKILSLKRKYGPTLEDVIERYEKMKKELEELYSIKEIIDEIDPQIQKMRKSLETESDKIIETSKKYLYEIKEQVEQNLIDLNMSNAKIDFYFEKLKEPDKSSHHKINFLLKTNPQSDFMALSKIASGGEMSRILLAIETVLGIKHAIDTVLFDEIDSGVGPRMADVVARKIEELSEKKQIIVITHMPQVANISKKHFKIIKNDDKNETFSGIIELSREEKEKEIKEMYGDIVYW